MPRKRKTPAAAGEQYNTRAKRHGEPKPEPRWGLKPYEPKPPEWYEAMIDGLEKAGLW